MDPILRAVLLSWDLRVDVLLVIGTLAALYLAGWRRLRARARRPRRHSVASGRRLASYLSGMAFLLLALISPFDVLSGQLFFVHMMQHLLLVMIAPPLLLIANPMPVMLWGLPRWARAVAARALQRRARVRLALMKATRPGLSWMLFVVVFLGWHDPGLYNSALRSEWMHNLEHLTFFGTGMLYWWHVTGAGPRIHGRFTRGARLAFVLVTVPVNMLAGVAITFSSTPIYTYYETVPRLWGLSVLNDQIIGGFIMWVPGSMMYLATAITLIAQLFNVDGPHSDGWATDESMRAPGWELDQSKSADLLQ